MRTTADVIGSPGPGLTGIQSHPLPAAVAGPFQVLTGLDVAAISVHRGPVVNELAGGYQAQAFTWGGEIFLPDEAGSLGHSDTQALLAHELVHAIQQRILAPSVPDEDSPHGQELENEAGSAERWYRSGGNAPLRLAHLPVAPLVAGHAGPPLPDRGTSETGRTVWQSPARHATQQAPGGVQRQPSGHQPPTAAHAAGQAQSVPATGPVGPARTGISVHGTPFTLPGSTVLARPAGFQVTPGEESPASPEPVAPHAPAAEPAATKKELDDLAEHSERLVGLAKKRPADLDDPASLDELASKVYPRLRGMLRGELLVDRERAGLLADPS